MLTAKADDDLRVRMLNEGVQDYLTKPFTVVELQARVERLMVMLKRWVPSKPAPVSEKLTLLKLVDGWMNLISIRH